MHRHSLGQLPHRSLWSHFCLRQKCLRALAIESGVDAIDVIQQMIDPHPTGQHSGIRNKADLLHQLRPLAPRASAQHIDFTLESRETQECPQKRGFTGAIGADKTHDGTAINLQVHAINGMNTAKLT